MRQQISFLIVAALALSGIANAGPHGIYPTRQQRELNHVLSVPRVPPKLLYYGGPVLANVKTYSIMWGGSVDSTTQKQIGGFLSATVNSTYMDWLKEYNTTIKSVDGRQGTNQKLGRGTYVKQITITPANTSVKLDDKDIQAEIEKQIDSGALPKPDGNTLFMIYFPPGISITIDTMASCMAFCAYHEGFVSQKYGNIFYGVMPDQGGACSLGCGFSPTPFDSLTEVSSHELIEATTDPFPTPKDKPAYPQAWNTTDGNEIGDLCAGNATNLTTQGLTYTLQAEFDNTTGKCTTASYKSP